MLKLNRLAAISVIGLTVGFSLPASAMIVEVAASGIQGDNVLFNNGTQSGSSVFGETQSGTVVEFAGTTFGGGTTISANGGQARLEGKYIGECTSYQFKLAPCSAAITLMTWNSI